MRGGRKLNRLQINRFLTGLDSLLHGGEEWKKP